MNQNVRAGVKKVACRDISRRKTPGKRWFSPFGAGFAVGLKVEIALLAHIDYAASRCQSGVHFESFSLAPNEAMTTIGAMFREGAQSDATGGDPMPANSTSFVSDPRTITARRMADKFHDPMKTRVLFYLQRLYSQKQNGEPLSQADMDRAIGRAAADGVDDQEVIFDREQVIVATQEATEGKKTTNLREFVDAHSGRDSR